MRVTERPRRVLRLFAQGLFARGRLRTAVVIASVVVLVGSVTAVGVMAASAAAEHARIEAQALAREQAVIDTFRVRLTQLQMVGGQIVDDATAWVASGSPLLTADDVAELQSTAETLRGPLALKPESDPTGAQLKKLWSSQTDAIGVAEESFGPVILNALAAAQGHLDAAPIADAVSRQAVSDAIAGLKEAQSTNASLTPPFAALTAAVATVDAAQAAAVAAAAAEAARRAEALHSGVSAPGEPACHSDVLTCVNQIRAFYGLGTLSSNGTLNSASQACADRMASSGSMTHSSPTPGFGWWGENIASGYGSEASVFNGWMNSPGHRANILGSHYTYMGLGYASGNWWCQQFGS